MTTDRIPAGYIATDAGLETGAIFGIGDTPEAALADAREAGRDPEATFGIVAATQRIIEASDQEWTVYRNGEEYLAPLGTDPDDLDSWRIADLLADAEELS